MKHPLITCLVIILMSSCSKENTTDNSHNSPPEPETKRYAPFSEGSYWVYQKYTIDPITKIETAQNAFDSLYVSSTKNINGIEYSRMQGTKFGQFVIDNYIGVDGAKLVDPNGNVFLDLLATNDTVSTVSGTLPIDSISTVFKSESTLLNLPYGLLISEHSKKLIFYQSDPFPSPLLECDFYSKDIGLVKYTTAFASSGLIVEMRLVRYFINP